ncbi:MAG: ribbon-helix-helix protein, CopG family [Gemmatimonadetes bacterium]|jgi:metal-responsive CopG/Arc/MetJ family transcriptional regulator|nr:ribbon-helix-helix protein, CopG family [Gemmatimonadota bacterium]
MPRVNIMLPDDLLEEIDRVAREEDMNRSKLLRTAVLAFFQLRAAQSERQKRQADIQRAMEIQDQLRQTIPSWDSLRALKEQREEM